jgi:hypothetical protein
MSSGELSYWRINNVQYHLMGTSFIGNWLCCYNYDDKNEINIDFGFKPLRDGIYKIVDNTFYLNVGAEVCINIQQCSINVNATVK